MLHWTEIALRLFLAAVFGGIIGIERERKDWTAGMRTHMMVCMGSALIMLVSSFGFMDLVGKEYAELDPSRVAAQIVSGIGFIGAGTILFRKPNKVMGLTTASGLWTVAGIGMAAGGGMYIAGGIATAFAILILWGMQPIQKRFANIFQPKTLIITLKKDAEPAKIIDILLHEKDVDYSNFSISRLTDELVIEIKLQHVKNKKVTALAEGLYDNSAVKKISWNK
ncbi:MgtC/SapB family protein [Flavobacterium sp. RHBU_24]|uniref:MgtC/SapB family protein n=1 Tax=Flavobacterium sp. RHBU_24 TaxID=3391185 RepID=UPI003984A15D